MKKLSKVLAMALAVALSMSALAGCGSKPDPAADTNADQTAAEALRMTVAILRHSTTEQRLLRNTLVTKWKPLLLKTWQKKNKP